ncbi:MAG: Fis family transcriptional regulator [Nitrospinae bacterium]|nr:Fis family transcriptional regulator [Nitrospinota bacterium]
MSIVEAWLAELQERFGGLSLTVSDVRIGVFYSAARISTGHTGVAFTPRNLADTVCCPQSAASAPPAGRMAGRDAWELASYSFSDVPLRRAVGVAVLNALSAHAMETDAVEGVRILPGVDALDAAGVEAEDTVAMVGGFTPFIKRLKGQVQELWIVDKHPEALKPDEAELWWPPNKASEIIPQASVIIITGSALVEGGLDELLAASSGARRVVLAGPTASPWPPPFFARGVHLLGGIRVLDGERILQIVSEGGSGYFFEDGAEKICMVPSSSTAQV